MRDYSSDVNSNLSSTSKMLSILSAYQDDFIRNRPIMDISVSPHFPELFAVAYGADSSPTSRTASINDKAPGVVCIWSLALKGRPEFKFTASSPVLAVRFHEQDPQLIIGGCYSGQILLWDIRAKSLPVHRSNMAGKGHKHPVYSLCMVALARH
jgi:dynein intermediate chain